MFVTDKNSTVQNTETIIMSQSSLIHKIDSSFLTNLSEVHALTVKKNKKYIPWFYLFEIVCFCLPSAAGTVPSLFEPVF